MANNLPALFAANTNVPAFLKNTVVENGLAAHHTASFKNLSIEGKNFTVVQGEERTTLMNPKDPDSPASAIEVVVIKASPIKHKVWYAGTYVKGGDQSKPDCFSTDGVKPDPQSEKPQAKSCMVCKKNQFGSKIQQDGTLGKGKACSDVIRLAVAATNAIDDPMLLRVPPASIKAAGDYGKLLAKRGVPLNGVVTKLKFDKDAPTPKLEFEPIGFLSQEQFLEANEAADSDAVEAILGMSPADAGGGDPDAASDGLGEVPEHLKAAAAGKSADAAAATSQRETASAATAATKKAAAAAAVAKPREKTPEELEAEEEERVLAELQAKKAAREAKKITTAKSVNDAEIAAAVEAAEQGLGVVGAKVVAEEAASQDNPVVGNIIAGDAIPDLASVTFDD
jgi:hypothetical protein